MDYTKIFYTVPIKSTLMMRDSHNKKVDGAGNDIRIGANWKQYQTNQNTNNTPLLGAIARNDFIGVDIDTNILYDKVIKLLSILPDNEQPSYVAQSMPIEANKGGHLLFAYTKETHNSLKKVITELKNIKIDIQLDNKLIYLATPANATKKLLTPPLHSLDDLTPIPSLLLTYLMGLVTPQLITSLDNKKDIYSYNMSNADSGVGYLGYILKGELTPTIVNVVTPKKDYPNIHSMNDIKYGQGTDWLLKVRKKLQVDDTVSPELFKRTIKYLNKLWSEPMDSTRITNDILRDLQDTSFKYNDNFNKEGLVILNHERQPLEIYQIKDKQRFIFYNSVTGEIGLINNTSDCLFNIKSQTGKKLNVDALTSRIKVIKVISTPKKLPYYNSVDKTFNTHVPTLGVTLLNIALNSNDVYIMPPTIDVYFKSLIPDLTTRNRFILYLAHKYSTYDYSPLYFVFAGIAGAGKGILINHILRYFSEDRVVSLDTQSITNNFNSTLGSADWIEIDEAGEGSNKLEIKKLVGKLKSITGSNKISIEPKGKERHIVDNLITPILTTNIQTKLTSDIPANDRRMIIVKCPTPLIKVLPLEIDGVTLENTFDLINKLNAELPYFAKHLGYLERTASIDPNLYSSNALWKGDDYASYVEETMTYEDKLLDTISNENLVEFIDVLLSLNVSDDNLNKLFNNNLKGCAVIIYATPKTRGLFYTLEDVFLSLPILKTSAKALTLPFRTSWVIRTKGKAHKVSVIQFNRPYTPRGTIEPIEGTIDGLDGLDD